MSEKTITVRLTIPEAEELLQVAGNGWGDGDYYGLNDKTETRGGRVRANLFCDARNKLSQAIYTNAEQSLQIQPKEHQNNE